MGKRIIIGGIAGLAILCVCGAVGIFVFGDFFNAADVGGFFNAADGGTGEVAISRKLAPRRSAIFDTLNLCAIFILLTVSSSVIFKFFILY